jgi:bifunctional enzyme CysN/CysC
MKTEALKRALDRHCFDAAIGGARRDEEASRAKERIFSVRAPGHAWDPRRQRPELWDLFNAQLAPGETMRIFPLSNWTELDVWDYIRAQDIPVVPLYFAAPRPVVRRDGMLIMVDDERLPLAVDERPAEKMVRFRSLDCYPLTAAVESDAATLDDVIAELRESRWSERAGRLIDMDETASGAQEARGLFLMDAIAPSASGETAHAGASRDLLRFVACGSVDDGKSTLIGRLIAETGTVPVEQIEALKQWSRKFGSAGEKLDCALLLDGLEAEREQSITIDVAYRYFSTPRRAFRVADTPGHEQYTRNMATGASNADVALILVDARNGITVQTCRHARIAALLGIRQVLLVVNKMDLVAFEAAAFAAIRDGFGAFAGPLGISAAAIPAVAPDGDNVVRASARMRWYDGPTVLEWLESIEVAQRRDAPLRFLVQGVSRPNGDFRGYAGHVARGEVRAGEEVLVARSGRKTRIARIVTFDGDLERAETGSAVTLTLADQPRGDMIVHPDAPPAVADQFAAHVIWLDDTHLLPGRTYTLRLGTQTAAASVTALRHKIDVTTGAETATRVLEPNEIGFCNLATAVPIALDPYSDNRPTGAFVLVDRISAHTVAAGMVAFALRRAANVHQQRYGVDKTLRAHMKAQRPCILWFTGLPGGGKSTILNLVEERLAERGIHTYALDGDNLRRGLTRDLGFTDFDRVENIRRAGEVARLMVDAGLVVLCAFVSPFRAERRMVRDLVGPEEFIEVFVDTPVEVCMERDPKGLYAKAREHTAHNVTGVDSPYEPPEHAELRVETVGRGAQAVADEVLAELRRRGILPV